MSLRTLTVQISPELYSELARRAEQVHSTVAEELVRAAEKIFSTDEQLPEGLERELSGLEQLGDSELWSAARRRLAVSDGQRLEELHFLKGTRQLSAAEEEEAQSLLAEYERHMLVRAKAMALLKQRGHDIAVLVHP
jgi:hypothetical protein